MRRDIIENRKGLGGRYRNGLGFGMKMLKIGKECVSFSLGVVVVCRKFFPENTIATDEVDVLFKFERRVRGVSEESAIGRSTRRGARRRGGRRGRRRSSGG